MYVEAYNKYENRSFPMYLDAGSIESITESNSRHFRAIIRTKSGDFIYAASDYNLLMQRLMAELST